MGIKEPFNAISHMVGVGLSCALTPLLVIWADGPLAVVAASIYGGSLVVMFTLSSIYHSIPSPKAEEWLLRLDRVGIYLLVMGTYTPVALVGFGGPWGWSIAGVEWGAAALAITLTLTVRRLPTMFHMFAYLLLGWAAVTALPKLLEMPLAGLAWLTAGGLLYTGGAAFYVRGRKAPGRRLGDHEWWHLFVLAGAAAHATFVARYVLLAP